MGSQFVDLNGDGHTDYLSATFDGSPHVAWGGEDGFAEPVRLKDKNGERLLISSIWDYEQKKHVVLDHALEASPTPKERCISALAYDWDGDGDHDLLLGSYEHGRLYRQMNEGTDAEPLFTGMNIPVMAGDIEFALPAKMTAPVLVDWDGDGDRDIITGTFGDSYGQGGNGGGVYLSLNEGREGAPQFGALTALIEPAAMDSTEATRPDAGLYPSVVDFDGDGDLDLVVGGYSMWTPEGRELNETEKALVEKMRLQQSDAQAAMQAVNEKMMIEVEEATKGMEQGSDEWRKRYSEIAERYSDERAEPSQRMREARETLGELVPSQQRKAFVWLYERQS